MPHPIEVAIHTLNHRTVVTAEDLRKVMDEAFPGREIPIYSLMKRLENQGLARRDGVTWTRRV